MSGLGKLHEEPLEPVRPPTEAPPGTNPGGFFGMPVRVDRTLPENVFELRGPRGEVLVRVDLAVDPVGAVFAAAAEAVRVIARARILSGSMAEADRVALREAIDAFDEAARRARRR